MDQGCRKDTSKKVKCIKIDDYGEHAVKLMGTKTEVGKWRDFVLLKFNSQLQQWQELKRIANEAVMKIVTSI